MLGLVEAYSPAQRAFRPAPQSWSMLDVINHLVLSEYGSYRFIAVQRDPARMPATLLWHHPLRKILMIVSLRVPVKFRKPAKIPEPQTEKDLQQLRHEWQEIQCKMQAFAEAQDEAFFTVPVLIHPFFGYLSLASTLRFFIEHIHHHCKQITRIAQANGFPR